ncbi:MAG: 6-bladed beta-propeller [Bacteroidaceae bacterium]|nr:6-bladed beta-propeller [Bacteroidaceae bacterium]
MKKSVISVSHIIFTICFWCSCSNTGQNHLESIHVDIVDSLFISCYSDSCDILFLKSDTVQGQLGVVTRVMYDDGLFFVSHKPTSLSSDMQQLIEVFDSTGTFVNQIGRIGRATNEYQGFRGWTVNPINKEVLICDDFRSRTIRYNYDGSYIGYYRNQDHLNNNQLFFSGNKVFYQNMIPSDIDDMAYYDETGKFNAIFQERKIKTEGFIMPGIRELSDCHTDTLYHIRPFDNILYSISDGRLNRGISLPFMPQLSKKDVRRIKTDSNLFKHIPLYGINTRDYYFLSIINEGVGTYAYEKRNNRWVRYTKAFYSDDLIMSTQFVGVGLGNDIIGVINFSEEDLKQLFEEDQAIKTRFIESGYCDIDNPSLVIYHLRSLVSKENF